MIVITTHDGTASSARIHDADFHTWKIAVQKIINSIVSVSAYGEDSQYIKQMFGQHSGPTAVWIMTIPWKFNSINMRQTWYGDIAKTIIMNL